MTLRIDFMPESCRVKLGRRNQIRFWVMVYMMTVTVIVGGNMLFELSKGLLRSESKIIGVKVSLDADQRVKANQVLDEINRIEVALDRNARIAWPIDISDVIAAIGSQAPESIFLTKIAIIPREERARTARRAKDEKGPKPLPRVRIQIECAGVAPDDHAMADFVAGLEEHPLFERLAVEHIRPATLGGREVKEFGVTFEVDFHHRFEFEKPVTSASGTVRTRSIASEADQ